MFNILPAKNLSTFSIFNTFAKNKTKKTHYCSLKPMHYHFIRCCLSNDFFRLKSRSVFRKPSELLYMPRLVLKHLKQCLTGL